MRAAVIDIGTNTFNLLVGHYDQGMHIDLSERIAVKLGEGGITKGYINYDAFTRGVEAMKQHVDKAHMYGADRIVAVATSATRSSVNGEDFVRVVERETGVRPQVISGDEEATLIYKGVSLALPTERTFLAMDIGGGSTEFILGQGDTVHWQCSTKLGVSRLKDLFNPSDPITHTEIEQVNAHFDEALKDLKDALQAFPTDLLAGSSGSFETISAMLCGPDNATELLGRVKKHVFSMQAFLEVHDFLIHSTLAQRLDHPGIQPFRADMIVIGSLLTKRVAELCGASQLVTSAYALREGLLHQLLTER